MALRCTLKPTWQTTWRWRTRLPRSPSLRTAHKQTPQLRAHPKITTSEALLPTKPPEEAPRLKQPYQIVNLYHLVEIADPDQTVQEHREWIGGRDIRGRIYFSGQGVNAQFTGSLADNTAYLDWMSDQELFQELRWNCDAVDQHMFPKLRLKHKPNLVQLNGGLAALPITQSEQRAIPLNSEEWKEKLTDTLAAQDETQKAVVLDVRNGYEWDAGHFEGAERPKEDSFRETPTAEDLPEPLKAAQKDIPVMMYCTGGIRCDIYSTVLRKHGFQNLYSLEGGVQKYFKEEGGDFWNGSLFVFDGRMAIHPNSVDGRATALPSSIQCELCGDEGQVPHVNCANVDCNRLFVACDACKRRLSGCCCQECIDAPRLLRPAQLEKGYYGKFGTYAMNRLKRSVREATERQLKRRERRLERIKQKRTAAKNARLQLKKQLRAEEERRGNVETSLKDALASMRNAE